MNFKGVKALILDVDGVLTDGSLYYTQAGEELKKFNIKDGSGIRLLLKVGIEVVVITGKGSPALDARFKELGIKHLYKNVRDKGRVLEKVSSKLNIPLEKMCFIADDLIDLPALKKVGFPVCVADSDPYILDKVVYVTENLAGHGAVREVINKILKDNQLFEKAIALYLPHAE